MFVFYNLTICLQTYANCLQFAEQQRILSRKLYEIIAEFVDKIEERKKNRKEND